MVVLHDKLMIAGSRVIVAIEHRFIRINGEIYSASLTYDRLWRRYLEVFDEVYVLARIADVETIPSGYQPAGGPGVHWIAVPYYHGPRGYLRVRRSVKRVVRSAVEVGNAFMLRVPGTLGTLLWRELKRQGLPYGVEVIGDPYDVFAPGANRSILRPLLRGLYTHNLRQQCRGASVAAYVTREALQRRYPCPTWTTSYSSVQMDDDAYITPEQLEARVLRYAERDPSQEWVCVHIGSMSQVYKRQDALIRAVAYCRANGLPLRLRLVGGGHLQEGFRKLAHDCGVADHVEFMGQLPAGQAVRDVLDSADFLVLPSMTEGLPRVVIEAMARGIPCLASNVGGVSELLDADQRFELSELDRLGQRIAEFVSDPLRLAELARRNLSRAGDYHADILQQRRIECYRRLADASGIARVAEVQS